MHFLVFNTVELAAYFNHRRFKYFLEIFPVSLIKQQKTFLPDRITSYFEEQQGII